MSASIALRQAGRSAARRALAPRSASAYTVRHASTSTHEEPDPQLNGYPQLPYVSNQTRPALGWDDPLMRRNFGETLHEQDEVLSMWGPDIPPVPVRTAVIRFLLAFGGFAGFGYLVKTAIAQDPPAVRREYPYSGLVQELGGMEENKARPESLEEED